jgi:hypothetical protein
MNNLTLSEKYRANQALATFQHLNLLDDVWTQYLDEARDISGEDVEILSSLTDRMQGLLNSSISAAEWLRNFIAEKEQDLNESLSNALEQYPLTNDARHEIQARFDERGGFAAMALAGTETVMREADEAREEIAAKMRTIKDGDFAPGDLPKGVKCALLAAAAASAVALHQYTIAVSIALHMSTIGCF